MDWIRARNRRLIAAIWREAMFQNRHVKADLVGTTNEWKFWEGLLAATPAGEDDTADLETEEDMTLEEEANRLAVELDLRHAELRRARAALEECLDYFRERQDGETFSDGTVSINEEMKLGNMVEEALGRGGR